MMKLIQNQVALSGIIRSRIHHDLPPKAPFTTVLHGSLQQKMGGGGDILVSVSVERKPNIGQEF